MDSCQLLRPDWLWLLLPLALLLWLMSRRRNRAGSWRSVCDSQLLPFILQGRESSPARWPLLVTGLAGVLAILALSGPACEQREQPVFRDQSALVIALDLSRSMDATDIKPSRLTRARLKLIDILKQRREGQTALIVYAAQAFTVSPLTDDADTIISLVGSLDSNMMPLQGSNASVAIAQAAQLLQQAGVLKGDILLITDGVADKELNAAEAEIKAHQHRVSVLSVGTAEGAPIALRDGGFLKDRSGAIVIPKLEQAPLQNLAQLGNGRYHPLSPDETDINYLLDIVTAEGKTEEAVKGLNTDQWREEGPWLLLLLAPLAALAFRRGYLAVLLVVLLPIPNDTYAAELLDLWRNNDQQALQKLQQGNAEHAAELFQSPEWKAAAQYRAGQFEQAAKTLQGINSAEGLYNKGNALARLGDYQAAIKAYDDTLKLQADHEDAEYNRELLKQQMQNQSQKDNSQGDESQQDSQGEQQQQQDQGQQDDSQSAEQQQSQQGDEQQQAEQQAGQQQEQNSEQSQPQAQQQADQEEADQAEVEQQQLGKEQDGEKEDAEEQQAMPSQDYTETSETDIATEQWLRRIPDDPGGLLRRKFQYQYNQQSRQQQATEIDPW